jgi:hypothetical protein
MANNVQTQSGSGVLGGAHMGGHSDVAKPKPNPTPTSVNQLKDTVSTMMNKPANVVAGSKQDPNTYSGSYGGSNWTISRGKTTRSK